MTRVLVVDDSLTVRMDLEEAFAGAGFAPALCADVASARRALARDRFEIVVLDVLLPDGDGLELLAEIRRAPEHAATSVLLLSTEAEVRHRLRGLEGGADEYVGKPYDRAHVVALARELAGRGQGAPADRRGPVLVVDDSLTAREALRSRLEEAGLSVVTAASGEEGLRLAAERLPSAVVVDARMPGVDGATFIRELRADAALRATPCILLTASGSIEQLPALEAGADAYVHKDESDAIVLARVQALLRTSSPHVARTPGFLTPKRLLVLGAAQGPAREASARLQRDGHDVAVAPSTEEGLALVATGRVDAILLDASSVPEPLEVCRRIDAHPARRDVPVLVLGADPARDLTAEALDAGADDYVVAGSGLELVCARVRALLRRKQFADEDRVRASFERSAAILESIQDAFFAVDREWRFVYANHAFERVVGATRQTLAGQRVWSRCDFLARQGVQDELRRTARERAAASFDARGPADRWFEVRAFPHQDGLSVYLRDVTERRRAEEVQRYLHAIVGHDLRTPLTAVSVSVEVLLRDATLTPKQRRSLTRIGSGAKRMTRLIYDLLDYSRLRRGEGLSIHPRPVELDSLYRDVVEEIHAIDEAWTLEYRHEGDGAGTWDPDRIQQALLNLVTNALHHGDQGGRVVLAWKGEPDGVSLSVHNDGAPIPGRLLERIFEPFTRGEVPRSSAGMGLGLYIVKEIATAHGGSVAVESRAGAGTTFTVKLPRRVAR